MEKIPSDVLRVWSLQMSVYPGPICFGLDLYNEIQKIIDDNPKYFPWEHLYKSIPNEVHNAFENECYGKIVNDEVPLGEGLLNNVQSYSLMKEFTLKDLEDVFGILDKMDEDKQKENRRIKRIWKKNYGKYKLKYRE